MIRRLIVATSLFLLVQTTQAQKQLTPEDSIAGYFNEIKVAAKKHASLWSKNLYGDDKGTVYPNIRITDNWGILDVKEGALMSPKWDRITITNPTAIEGRNVTGNGWVITLNKGYVVEKDATDGKYKLLKK